MTLGFPAHFNESRTFHHYRDELASAVKFALDNLGWRYETLSDNEFRAGVSVTMWSWGEKVSVELQPGGVLHVESKCAFPLQVFDWGKNKKNVETFFAQVEEIKERRALVAASDEIPPAFDAKGHSPLERVFREQDEE